MSITNELTEQRRSSLSKTRNMHLKNFSLINQPNIGWVLCPAYDMVPSALVVKGDTEELALSLNDFVPEAFTGKYEFEYKISVEALLNTCSNIFTKAALSRITGINQRPSDLKLTLSYLCNRA